MTLLGNRGVLFGGVLLAGSVLVGACDQTTTLSDRCFVIVAAVSPAAPTLAASDTVHLAATYNNVAAECLPSVPASALVWRSSAPDIATVDSLSGFVTGVAAGTTQVGAFAPGSTKVLGFARIAVTGP